MVLNAGNIFLREQAEAHWNQRLHIGNNTRSCLDWLGRISDVALWEYMEEAKRQPHSAITVAYRPSTIGMKRRALGVAAFTGNGLSASYEIAVVRYRRNKELIHLWATKRPKGMAEYVRELAWNKLMKQHGETL